MIKTIYILMLFLALSVSGNSQSKPIRPFKIIFGYEGSKGVDKIANYYNFNYNNSHLYMRSAYFPSVGVGYFFKDLNAVSIKAGYGFLKSSNLVENGITYPRKLNDIKIDLDIRYNIIKSNSFQLALMGQVGLNRIIEKAVSKENTYANLFGYGFGVSISINKEWWPAKGLIIPIINYYKIGDNKLLGLGIIIPLSTNF